MKLQISFAVQNACFQLLCCIIHTSLSFNYFTKNNFDEFCNLGYNTVWFIENQPQFSGVKSKKPTWRRQEAQLGWLSLAYMVLGPRIILTFHF
jgi:hypothetical protein